MTAPPIFSVPSDKAPPATLTTPSVCLSVTLLDQEHIGWKSWKLIARTINPTPSLFIAQGKQKTVKNYGDKKVSYCRETARQLPTWRGLGPPAHSPAAPSGYTYGYGRIRNPRVSSVPYTKRTLGWIGHSRSFKVILIGAGRNPERCVVVMCN